MGLYELVRPPGLEPGPKASEAFMVSNSTTGTRHIFISAYILLFFAFFLQAIML